MLLLHCQHGCIWVNATFSGYKIDVAISFPAYMIELFIYYLHGFGVFSLLTRLALLSVFHNDQIREQRIESGGQYLGRRPWGIERLLSIREYSIRYHSLLSMKLNLTIVVHQ